MKNTLKVINYVLLGLTLVAVGFGVFAFFQYRAVPIAEYESSAADLRAQTQLVDESTDKLSEDMKAQQDALREDISQGGDEGKTLASELAAALSDNEDKTAQLEELRAENERLDNIVEETLAKRREYASKIRELEEKVREGGAADLQLLGIGNNGHIAFNEASDHLIAVAHTEKLTESTINANARFFEKKEDVPTMAITMGMGDILAAKKVVLAATGLAKVPAIKGLIMDDVITTQNPSTMLKMHEDAVVVIDRELADAVGYRA